MRGGPDPQQSPLKLRQHDQYSDLLCGLGFRILSLGFRDVIYFYCYIGGKFITRVRARLELMIKSIGEGSVIAKGPVPKMSLEKRK